MAFAPGNQVGKYLLGAKIGAGGFGEVFLATDTALDREVALKFLHSQHTSDPELLKRFLQEAKSAAKIDHPGIVTIHEYGQITGTGTPADGTAFIAMERLHGESLAARIEREKQLTPAAAVEIVRQVTAALAAAHDKGVVHRDLKPDNVFLVPDALLPSGERIKVLDFGIAKLAAASGVNTDTSMVFGTPRYMSPEQCRSATSIDHRSDIYTLGVILFELLTGRPPFEGASGELIAKHQLVEPPQVSSMIALPEALDKLVASLLAKEPEDRPATMQKVGQALAACAPLVANLSIRKVSGVAETMAPSQPTYAKTHDQGPQTPKTPAVALKTPVVPEKSKSVGPRVSGPNVIVDEELQPPSDPTSPPRKKPVLLLALAVVAAGGIAFAIVMATSHKDKPVAAVQSDAAAVVAVAASADAPDVIEDSAIPPDSEQVAVAVLVDAGVPVDAHRRSAAPPDAHHMVVLNKRPIDAGVVARDAAAAIAKRTTWPPEGTPMNASTLRNIMARCQGEYTDAHPGTLNGLEINVSALVDNDGTVNIKAHSQLPEIDRCVERIGKGMIFPPGHPVAQVNAQGGTVLRPPGE